MTDKSGGAKVLLTGQGLYLAAPSLPGQFTIDLGNLKKKYSVADLRVSITVSFRQDVRYRGQALLPPAELTGMAPVEAPQTKA